MIEKLNQKIFKVTKTHAYVLLWQKEKRLKILISKLRIRGIFLSKISTN